MVMQDAALPTLCPPLVAPEAPACFITRADGGAPSFTLCLGEQQQRKQTAIPHSSIFLSSLFFLLYQFHHFKHENSPFFFQCAHRVCLQVE